MFCTVYRLRNFGERLDSMAIARTAARGYLTLGPRPLGPQHILIASLGRLGGPENASLSGAEVTKIGDTGIMIRGVETFGNYKIARQVWWCVPCEPGEGSENISELLRSRDPVTGSELPP